MKFLSMLLLSCLPAAAQAQPPAPIAPAPAGDDVRNWIDLQTRTAASPAPPRPMSGEVADQVFQRYLKSFSHPIPDQFQRQDFVEGGGTQ